jgi:hypothetical protein
MLCVEGNMLMHYVFCTNWQDQYYMDTGLNIQHAKWCGI